MKTLVRAIEIGGYKKSGKTRVVENLVKELKKRGHRVGTIKHVPQEGFTIDQPETDTWRHAQAGAEKIVLISPDEIATLEKKEMNLEEALSKLENLDFVIIEGFRDAENLPKIMVPRDSEEVSELDDEFTVGFVGQGSNKPVFDSEEVTAIADFVEQEAIPPVGGLDCGDCGYDSCREFVLAVIDGKAPKDGCTAYSGKVSLTVDGKEVPLKPFVTGLIEKTISGMVSSLKDTEGERIEIEVRKDEG